MWEVIFVWTNVLAAAMWLALIAGPRKPALLSGVLFVGVGLLCLVYAAMFAGLMGGLVDPVRSAGAGLANPFEYSVTGLMDQFRSRGVMVLGWTHYLAFDLFVGLWIARDADGKEFSRLVQAPVLFATFLAGPIGLLVWLGVRERRARASGRWQ
jgi:Domain of unknown function (DUF4281)